MKNLDMENERTLSLDPIDKIHDKLIGQIGSGSFSSVSGSSLSLQGSHVQIFPPPMETELTWQCDNTDCLTINLAWEHHHRRCGIAKLGIRFAGSL
jgi:hypothetical protein